MPQVEATDVIKMIQSQIKILKNEYAKGSIDLKTLQKVAKHLNMVAEYVAVMSRNQTN